MSPQVIRLTAADFDEAMEFLNGVFGEHRPHNFATLLPAIYQATDEHMAANHAVREDGQLCAVVGLFPIDWQVGDHLLKVGGIGGVSTHRSVRGKGYMSLLMSHCVEHMRAEGFHLSWLGGQRQRYGYHGYEKCGPSPAVSLTPANLRHALPVMVDLRFEPLGDDDAAHLAAAVRLHEAQPVHCRRPLAHFARYLRSWYHVPHVALDAGGDMVGYLVADEEGSSVYELLADDDDMALQVAGAWVQTHETTRFTLPPTADGLLRRLGALGEGVSLGSSGNWQIFDWAATVEALLRVRAAGGILADGEVALGIEGYGALRIRVRDAQPVCTRDEEAAAAVTWTPSTVMRVLFGPLAPTQVTDIPAAAAALQAWCPLPLGWPRQDGV